MTIQLPPLRARADDIPLLVEDMLRELVPDEAVRERVRRRLPTAALVRMDWPGNVRELRNHVERSLVLDHGQRADAEAASSVDELPGLDLPFAVARDAWQRWFERRYLTELLQRHGGNVSAAAKNAGMHRSHLYRLLQRAGLM